VVKIEKKSGGREVGKNPNKTKPSGCTRPAAQPHVAEKMEKVHVKTREKGWTEGGD